MTEIRAAILCSFNLDTLPRYLGPALARKNLPARFHFGGFGQYRQEILDDRSDLYAFGPEFVFLFLDGQDVLADLCQRPFDLAPEEREAYVDESYGELKGLVDVLARRLPEAVLFVHTLAAPPLNSLGLLEFNSAFGLRDAFARFNGSLAALARARERVYLLDYESLVGYHGYKNWFDPRMWTLGRMRLGRMAVESLADYYATVLSAARGARKKVLVLDLDDTLWGGVLGAEGPGGILLGTDGIGLAFREFQQEILNLHRRGILLAINSKNNPEEALEVFDQHPAMVLRREHFAGMRINWQDKASNMRELAQELNLGLDSFVFMDDSPVECEWVSSQIPDVTVVQLPEDPALYRDTLLRLDAFASFGLTEEDLRRGELYQEQTLRRGLRESVPTLEEFYEALNMRALVTPASDLTVSRIAQLTEKTNQFNLTTRRYSEAEVRSLVSRPDWEVFGLSLTDKFGDSGLVGVGILAREGETARIDTLLLSCRVMGRTIETAFLAFLAEWAAHRGARLMVGEYIATKKNGPVERLYEAHGFEPMDSQGHMWQLDLESYDVACPEYIDLEYHE